MTNDQCCDSFIILLLIADCFKTKAHGADGCPRVGSFGYMAVTPPRSARYLYLVVSFYQKWRAMSRADFGHPLLRWDVFRTIREGVKQSARVRSVQKTQNDEF